MYRSHLRDLAQKIREVARNHIARSQVAEFMNHIDDHLNALARIEEFNRREYDREEASGGGGQCLPKDVPDGGGPAGLLP
jgi:hypothetical protein